MKKYNVDKVISSLIDNLETQRELNKKNYSSVHQVDGTIIGNGSQDFTKTYTEYNFKINDEDCQLLDVPGIEGKEAKYINIINDAIKKAHLVCYVAREDKGIEETTLEKIKSYLGSTVEVMGIHNISVNPKKGYDGDDYLGDLKSAIEKSAKASKNIAEALQRVIPEDLYATTVSTAVLPALCSLAMSDEKTTSFAEPKDFEEKSPEVQESLKTLRRQQENFFLHCYRKDLLDVSRIADLRNAIIKSCSNTPDRIKKSAYVRLDEKIDSFYTLVTEEKNKLNIFYTGVKNVFEKDKTDINNAISQMRRNMKNGMKNAIKDFYMQEIFEAIISPHIEKNEKVVKDELEYELNVQKERLSEKYKSYMSEFLNVTTNDFTEKLKRLNDNFSHAIQKDFEILSINMPSIDINNDFGEMTKTGLGVLLSIGGYALSGFALGSFVPVIGNVIGTIIGAVVGLVMAFIGLFQSRDKKIAKAKNQMREKIEEIADAEWKKQESQCERMSNELAEQASKLISVHESVVYAAKVSLDFVDDFLKKQDALRKEIKQKINSLEVSYAN